MHILYVYYFHKQHHLTHYGKTAGAFMNCVNAFVFKSGSSKWLKREVRNNNYVQSSQKKKQWITERETTAKSQDSPLKTWKRPKRAANKMKTKKTEMQNDHKWDTQHDVKQLKGDNHKETHSYCKKDAKWPQKIYKMTTTSYKISMKRCKTKTKSYKISTKRCWRLL